MDAALATVVEARECMCLVINFAVFQLSFEGQGGWDGAACFCFDAFNKRHCACLYFSGVPLGGGVRLFMAAFCHIIALHFRPQH